MSDDGYNSSSSSSSDEAEREIVPVWELLFDESTKERKNVMILENLRNKKVKVWSVLANTVNGVRGTWKGQVGVLTSFDDEFIVLDNAFILSRKFIYRIELV